MLVLTLLSAVFLNSPSRADDPRLVSHCAALLMTPRRTAAGTTGEVRYLLSRLLRKEREQLGDDFPKLKRGAEFTAVGMTDIEFMGTKRRTANARTVAQSAARLTRLDQDIERTKENMIVLRISRGNDAILEDLRGGSVVSREIDRRVPRVSEPLRPNAVTEQIHVLAAGIAVGYTVPDWSN